MNQFAEFDTNQSKKIIWNGYSQVSTVHSFVWSTRSCTSSPISSVCLDWICCLLPLRRCSVQPKKKKKSLKYTFPTDIDAERPIKMEWSEEGSRRRGATDDMPFTWRHCHTFVKVKITNWTRKACKSMQMKMTILVNWFWMHYNCDDYFSCQNLVNQN